MAWIADLASSRIESAATSLKEMCLSQEVKLGEYLTLCKVTQLLRKRVLPDFSVELLKKLLNRIFSAFSRFEARPECQSFIGF